MKQICLHCKDTGWAGFVTLTSLRVAPPPPDLRRSAPCRAVRRIGGGGELFGVGGPGVSRPSLGSASPISC